MDNYKLCYASVVDDWTTYHLYFTDNYVDQWGDDWNDRPADCNAGDPYEDDEHHIVSMYLSFDCLGSDIIFGGKSYSVEDMNYGMVPWIVFKGKSGSDYKLMGGDTFMEVLTKVEISGKCKYWVDKKLVEFLCESLEEIYEKVEENSD